MPRRFRIDVRKDSDGPYDKQTKQWEVDAYGYDLAVARIFAGVQMVEYEAYGKSGFNFRATATGTNPREINGRIWEVVPVTPPRIETLTQFARRTGGKTECDRFMLVNASLRSASMRKSAIRRRDQAWDRICAEIETTNAAYAQAIRAGEVVPPPPLKGLELLIATANGHPDNQSVQAARRLLAKRKIAGLYDGPIPSETA